MHVSVGYNPFRVQRSVCVHSKPISVPIDELDAIKLSPCDIHNMKRKNFGRLFDIIFVTCHRIIRYNAGSIHRNIATSIYMGKNKSFEIKLHFSYQIQFCNI